MVIDASVAVKLIDKNEEYSALVEALYEKHLSGEERIIIPNFLLIEVANYLATKTSTTTNSIENSLFLLANSSFQIEPVEYNLLLKATTLAKKYNTSVYDMLYSVLAQNKSITLLTADEKFVRNVNLPHVKLLGK